MIFIPRNRASFVSTAVLLCGGLCMAVAINKTLKSQSDRYWPLLVFGFVIACAAAPFYYYFKDRGRTASPWRSTAIDALATAGKMMHEQKITAQKQAPHSLQPKSVFPGSQSSLPNPNTPDHPKENRR